jgi:ABC-2 type transport system permease protein
MGIVLTVYLVDCLYAERKDRSILFWKSMPVADGLTVASKFLVASVVIPLWVFALAVVSGLLITGIYGACVALYHLNAAPVWDTPTWFRIQVIMLLGMIASVLWYAPVSAYLMLVSAWARRNVYMWAFLPPVLAPIFERIVFGTHYIYGFLVYRLAGIGRLLDIRHADVIGGHVHMRPITWTGERSFGAVFTSVDLWLGVLVAIVLLIAAARIRRYRDDT